MAVPSAFFGSKARVVSRAPADRKSETDGRTDGRTDKRTENLPILQDFIPYRGRCPKGLPEFLIGLSDLLV